MKKYFIFIFISFFVSCINYIETGMTEIMSVYNCSDEAIYVYYSYQDSLQYLPKLELFPHRPEYGKNDIDPYVSPSYRINPHNYSYLDGQSAAKKDWIPFPNNPEINYVNFFFIKESTMKKYTWEEIVDRQMYMKKVKYSYDELKKMDYEIYYKDDKIP